MICLCLPRQVDEVIHINWQVDLIRYKTIIYIYNSYARCYGVPVVVRAHACSAEGPRIEITFHQETGNSCSPRSKLVPDSLQIKVIMSTTLFNTCSSHWNKWNPSIHYLYDWQALGPVHYLTCTLFVSNYPFNFLVYF